MFKVYAIFCKRSQVIPKYKVNSMLKWTLYPRTSPKWLIDYTEQVLVRKKRRTTNRTKIPVTVYFFYSRSVQKHTPLRWAFGDKIMGWISLRLHFVSCMLYVVSFEGIKTTEFNELIMKIHSLYIKISLCLQLKCFGVYGPCFNFIHMKFSHENAL